MQIGAAKLNTLIVECWYCFYVLYLKVSFHSVSRCLAESLVSHWEDAKASQDHQNIPRFHHRRWPVRSDRASCATHHRVGEYIFQTNRKSVPLYSPSEISVFRFCAGSNKPDGSFNIWSHDSVLQLPGVDTLCDYNFRYGRSPFLELPLAINPTGCARSEPKLRTHFKRYDPLSLPLSFFQWSFFYSFVYMAGF